MSYENPQQPEGINVSDEHPVRDLFVLLSAVILSVVVLVVLLSSIASWLAQYVPFSTEQRLAKVIGIEAMFESDPAQDSTPEIQVQAREAYVLELGRQLIERAGIDADMSITVHYKPSATVNAFATLGGHVVMFDGLISRLPNENALAMVLAHEIGHIKLRHPVVAMSRGLTVSLALGSFLGITDNTFTGRIVEWIGYSSSLSYSRDQEREADAFASQLLINHYGHLNGAEDLFAAFQEVYDRSSPGSRLPSLDFLSTHPGLAERIDELREKADALGASGTPVPLPWAQ
ncbi:MAG: M48 family metallopeptidase [Pseudomonadaceae bacterium]|nr:M48 family metallopeptidase [Pseudomonadaceae bacterium]